MKISVNKELIIAMVLVILTIVIIEGIYLVGYTAGIENINNTEAWYNGYNDCMTSGGK